MGLDLGLEQTGHFNILACVEKEFDFCETIRRNRDAGHTCNPELRVYEVDIQKLSPEQVMNDLGIGAGDIDLLVGGPPYQSFSTAGRRRTVQDTRGSLLWQF